MRCLIFCYIFAGLLGCSKKKNAPVDSFEVFDSQKPARPELEVYEEVGHWEQENRVKTNNKQAQLTSASVNVRRGLKGHFVILESKVSAGKEEKYNLIVKYYNDLVEVNNYECVWFQDDGLVQGFTGSWESERARMTWQLNFPKKLPKSKFSMEEIYPKYGERIFKFKIEEGGKLISGESKAVYMGEGFRRPKKRYPKIELSRLGSEGYWNDYETVRFSGETIELKGQSRQRLSSSGLCMISEGVKYTEGAPEYYMWVKTWDSEQNIYRMARFFESGPAHHYVGDWLAPLKTIKWVSVEPPGAIEIMERLERSSKRSWTYTVWDGDKTNTGKGVSNFVK